MSELSIQTHEIADTNANEEVNEEENITTLLANSATSKDIKLGDIRNLMHTPSTPTTKETGKKAAFSSEVVMNGKTYRKVEIHVACCASESKRSTLHSLVERGANSGTAGNDARIIENTLIEKQTFGA